MNPCQVPVDCDKMGQEKISKLVSWIYNGLALLKQAGNFVCNIYIMYTYVPLTDVRGVELRVELRGVKMLEEWLDPASMTPAVTYICMCMCR